MANDQQHSGGKPHEQQQLVDLAGHSYGITSDPITQFAVVFSAVIHDADQPGVPNATLVQENTRLAKIYQKSIAEQNSVDLVWGLLMSPTYADLRGCIYSNEEELRRFRQLVVNTVMATDIVDKELQALRKARWETAFSDNTTTTTTNVLPDALDMNRKATIVIEHLIQASDVSHTMQHWQ
jgi:3'5'-cyclic nucleotide phosphodiesterase